MTKTTTRIPDEKNCHADISAILKIDDDCGIAFLESKPDWVREATLEDFHSRERKKLGMPYLVYSRILCRYSVYRVSPSLTASWIKPLIDKGRVFVFTGNTTKQLLRSIRLHYGLR